MSWLDYVWSTTKNESEDESDLGVIPLLTDETLGSVPASPTDEDKVGYAKTDLELLQERLDCEIEHNIRIKKSLIHNLNSRADITRSYTTYHRVTWAIITIIPLTNCLIQQDLGIALSILSFALCLSVSDLYILSEGYGISELYRKMTDAISEKFNPPSQADSSDENDYDP